MDKQIGKFIQGATTEKQEDMNANTCKSINDYSSFIDNSQKLQFWPLHLLSSKETDCALPTLPSSLMSLSKILTMIKRTN